VIDLFDFSNSFQNHNTKPMTGHMYHVCNDICITIPKIAFN